MGFHNNIEKISNIFDNKGKNGAESNGPVAEHGLIQRAPEFFDAG